MILYLIVVMLLLCLALLAAIYRKLSQRIDTLYQRDDCPEWSVQHYKHLEEQSQLTAFQQKRSLIVIEILDPVHVAKRESTLAALFSALTPSLIIRKVYIKAVETINEEFRERDIRTQVTLILPETDNAKHASTETARVETG